MLNTELHLIPFQNFNLNYTTTIHKELQCEIFKHFLDSEIHFDVV